MNSTYLRNSVVRFNRCTVKSFSVNLVEKTVTKMSQYFYVGLRTWKKNIAIFSSLIRPLTTTADLQKILLQFNNLRRLRYQNETSNWFYWCEETVNYFSVCTKTTCLFKSRLPKSKTQNFVQKFLAKLHLKKAQVIQMLCDWLYSRQLKSKSV